jgi:hypothetical protein
MDRMGKSFSRSNSAASLSAVLYCPDLLNAEQEQDTPGSNILARDYSILSDSGDHTLVSPLAAGVRSHTPHTSSRAAAAAAPDFDLDLGLDS